MSRVFLVWWKTTNDDWTWKKMCFFFFKGTGGTDLIMTNGSNQQILEQTGIAPLFLFFLSFLLTNSSFL
jgi:hypothetical protein